MKRRMVKALIICAFLCTYSADIVFSAENTEMPETKSSQFTVRVEKEDFEEIPDSLIIENQNKKLNLNKKLSPSTLMDGFPGDDMITFEKNPADKTTPIANKEPEGKPKSYDDSANQPNILNVNLAYLRNQNIVQTYGSFENNDKFASYSVIANKSIDSNELKKTLSQVKNLFSKGLNSEANSILNELSSYNLETCWDFAEVAGLLELTGEHHKAAKVYERAVAKNPKRIELLYSYSLSLYKNNRLDEAETNLKKIIKINPEFTLAHYNLGNIYYKKNQLYNALDSFNKAIKLNPLSLDSYYNAALVLESLNQKELAVKYFYECLKLKPDDVQSLKAIARLNRAG